MTIIDWVVILAYFGLLLALTWWVIRKNRDTADDYFLAGRNLGWLVVGASIFASNIGSEHLVGLAGSGATSGVALAHYELHAWCLLVLAWVFDVSPEGIQRTEPLPGSLPRMQVQMRAAYGLAVLVAMAGLGYLLYARGLGRAHAGEPHSSIAANRARCLRR
jgi:Na+/pantothenate symporter